MNALKARDEFMCNCLHLAILAGDLTLAKKFYCDVLACKVGNCEEGRWVDIDFWGNELTANIEHI